MDWQDIMRVFEVPFGSNPPSEWSDVVGDVLFVYLPIAGAFVLLTVWWYRIGFKLAKRLLGRLGRSV